MSCRKDTVGTAVLLKSESHVRVLRQEPGLPQGHAAIVPAARPLALPMSPREPRHLSWWPNLPASGVQLWCPECTCSRANTGCGTARGVRLPSMGPPGGAQIRVRQTALTQDLPFPAFANASCSGRPPSDFLVTKWGQALSFGASRGSAVQPRVPPADQALPLLGFFGNRCLLPKCSASFLSVISSAGLVQQLWRS